MISKKVWASLIFNNLNKTDDWYGVCGSFYEGKVLICHFLGNNCDILSFLMFNYCWCYFYKFLLFLSVFDEAKKVLEKNIYSCWDLKKFSKLSMAAKRGILSSYHCLSEVFPYTLEEWNQIAGSSLCPPTPPIDTSTIICKYFCYFSSLVLSLYKLFSCFSTGSRRCYRHSKGRPKEASHKDFYRGYYLRCYYWWHYCSASS